MQERERERERERGAKAGPLRGTNGGTDGGNGPVLSSPPTKPTRGPPNTGAGENARGLAPMPPRKKERKRGGSGGDPTRAHHTNTRRTTPTTYCPTTTPSPPLRTSSSRKGNQRERHLHLNMEALPRRKLCPGPHVPFANYTIRSTENKKSILRTTGAVEHTTAPVVTDRGAAPAAMATRLHPFIGTEIP